MRKCDEVSDKRSCLNKATDNELMFVLLARDFAFPETVRFWVQERIRLGLNHVGDRQVVEALLLADTVEEEQRGRRTVC